MTSLVELERLDLERVVTRLEAAKAKGQHDGKLGALDGGKSKLTRRLKYEGEYAVEAISWMLGLGRSTLYKYLGEDMREWSEKR